MATQEATLRIPALHCGTCATNVKRYVQALPGVDVTLVDPDSKLMRLSFEESTMSLDQIREALDEVGFSAED